MSISKSSAKKLFEIYVDTQITVYLRDMNIVTINEDQTEMKVSIMAEGYCIDIDEDFIYLGLPNGEITKTINHQLGQFIEITFGGGEMIDADFPTDEDSIN